MFNESCRGPRCGVAKTRIVHTAAAIAVKYDNGMLPYSPLYTGSRHKPRDARLVLDAAYCFSLGVPCDAVQHLAGMRHKVAESLYENFKTVTAVAEYVICKQSFFEDSAWGMA